MWQRNYMNPKRKKNMSPKGFLDAKPQVGIAMGWDGPKDGVFVPPSCIILSYSIPALPRITGKNFSSHPCPLGPRETPPHPVKLYFLLICPTTNTIFLMKPISLIKIYLKLQLNLSHQIKSIFRKN